jgi:Flp pilus assembly protein TadG
MRHDTGPSAVSIRTLLGRATERFRRDQQGATAVEFALIALPFFALLFAILETAMIFLVGQALETATEDSARLIRTGQAQQSGFDVDDFRKSICDQIAVLFNCPSKLILDVRTAADFASVDLSTPVFAGELDDDDFEYDDGSGEEIVVVRAFYEWPTVTQFLGEGFTKLANGNHLLTAAAAFRNEPFPW